MTVDIVGFHLRRERHAEKLRRSFEARGREQNGIFESLAEYTHEMQAQVRALQIARDRLNAAQPPSGGEDVSSTSPRTAPPLVGSPLVFSDRWISFEVAAAGVVSCGLLGFVAGLLAGWGWRPGKVVGAVHRRRVHED